MLAMVGAAVGASDYGTLANFTKEWGKALSSPNQSVSARTRGMETIFYVVRVAETERLLQQMNPDVLVMMLHESGDLVPALKKLAAEQQLYVSQIDELFAEAHGASYSGDET